MSIPLVDSAFASFPSGHRIDDERIAVVADRLMSQRSEVRTVDVSGEIPIGSSGKLSTFHQ